MAIINDVCNSLSRLVSLYSSFQSNIENVGNVVITEMFLCCYTTEGSLSIYLFKTFNFSSVTNLDISHFVLGCQAVYCWSNQE